MPNNHQQLEEITETYLPDLNDGSSKYFYFNEDGKQCEDLEIQQQSVSTAGSQYRNLISSLGISDDDIFMEPIDAVK